MKPKLDFKLKLPHRSVPDTSKILETLSDEISIRLFMKMGLSTKDIHYDSLTLMNKLKISKKQFYTKIANLQKCGLVKRTNRTYYLTVFGKLVLHSMRLIEDATKVSWKLKVIDALEPSTEVEDSRKLIDTLIDNERINAILKSKYCLQ
jgi:hypothetical protein